MRRNVAKRVTSVSNIIAHCWTLSARARAWSSRSIVVAGSHFAYAEPCSLGQCVTKLSNMSKHSAPRLVAMHDWMGKCDHYGELMSAHRQSTFGPPRAPSPNPPSDTATKSTTENPPRPVQPQAHAKRLNPLPGHTAPGHATCPYASHPSPPVGPPTTLSAAPSQPPPRPHAPAPRAPKSTSPPPRRAATCGEHLFSCVWVSCT